MKYFTVYIFLLTTTAAIIPAIHLDSKIVAGTDADINEYPFMVLIKSLRKGSSEFFNCAGTLISHQWVISAAFCVYDIQHVILYLGNIYAMEGTSYNIQPENTIIHEQFDPILRINDISLIQIPYTKYTAAINHIELPYSYEHQTFIGIEAKTLGWGYTKNTGPSSIRLEYLPLVVATKNACLQRGVEIRDTNMCVATKRPRSPCNGDEGGPLVYFSATGPIAIGITSYLTDKNCENGHPIVYTRLTKYLLWLDTKISLNKISVLRV